MLTKYVYNRKNAYLNYNFVYIYIGIYCTNILSIIEDFNFNIIYCTNTLSIIEAFNFNIIYCTNILSIIEAFSFNIIIIM